MAECPQILLTPCPFCEGPPVPLVQSAIGGGAAPLQDDYGDDGLDVEAIVFCHECGATGPGVDRCIYERADYFEAEAEAVQLWQQHDARNRDLYDAGAAEGLNLYPRSDELSLRETGATNG